MLLLDLILRGSSIGLLVLLAGLLWRSPIGWEGRVSVFAVALAQSAFLLETSPMPLELPSVAAANLILLACLLPNAITWLIVTIFLDPPGKRWPWLVASSFVSLHAYLHQTAPELVAAVPCEVSALVLYGALFGLALLSARDDLVECRCKARPGFAAAIAAMGLLLTGMEVLGLTGDGNTGFALMHSGGSLAVIFAFAVWILRPDTSLWPGEREAVATPRPAPQPQDTVLIARISDAMDAGIWREEGLTIGALALHLNVPEHRVRRAINNGLGHRNFSTFINRARVEAAKAQLSDPAEASTTVLEIAYSTGFASLGPFNRAFRAETGQSPTEFRQEAFSKPADSENHKSIPVNLH